MSYHDLVMRLRYIRSLKDTQQIDDDSFLNRCKRAKREYKESIQKEKGVANAV